MLTTIHTEKKVPRIALDLGEKSLTGEKRIQLLRFFHCLVSLFLCCQHVDWVFSSSAEMRGINSYVEIPINKVEQIV